MWNVPNVVYAEYVIRTHEMERVRKLRQQQLIAQAQQVRASRLRWFAGAALLHSGRLLVRLGNVLTDRAEAQQRLA
jgi:hypothetical protein